MQSGKGVVHLTELESGDYKSICENLYDGIHITDGTGTILFINKAYTRTTGILPEELLGCCHPHNVFVRHLEQTNAFLNSDYGFMHFAQFKSMI